MQLRRWLMMIALAVAALGSVLYHRYNQAEMLSLEGQTMGTYYRIKAVDNADASLDDLKPKFELALKNVNKSLSTWDKNSLISIFNANLSDLDPYKIDADFVAVMAEAQDIYSKSNGTFNPALAPLITLWGFDRNSDSHYWPKDQEITAALANSDFSTVTLKDNFIQRSRENVTLNFSAIAKGYGVDILAAILEDAGYQDFLVDIGGEVRAKGLNGSQNAWRIGIEQPDQEGGIAETVVELRNAAIATSGDYRNFRIKDGQRFSHIIDPRTGKPIDHSVASVSVLADTAMVADGWATALLVLGEAGMAICEAQNLACFMISREGSTFRAIESSNWSAN